MMSEETLKEICAKDERSLEELINSLIERKAISLKIAKKYFNYKD